MRNRKLFSVFVMVICLCGWGNIAFAEEAHDYWLNPAYRGLSPNTVSVPKAERAADTPTTCRSYDEFESALKSRLGDRITQFGLRLIYDFSFSDVLNISGKVFDKTEAEDPYLFYNIQASETNALGRSGDVTLTYAITYLSTYDQEQQVSQRVSEILAQIITSSMNDGEKAKAIHDWVVTNVKYDTDKTRYGAYSALFVGKSVCQGYALLVCKMLKQVGIQTRIVSGRGYGNGSWQDHTWNLAYLCGNWYHVDATFDDPLPDVAGRVLHTYFEKSDSEMSEHSWDSTQYPAASVSYASGGCDNDSGNSLLVWQTSKASAVSLAKTQGKKILLFAGRETCPNCQYMKYTACESSSPSIKSLIGQYFVPWFCDIDNSTEWYPYSSGLGTFGLPLICVIDPNDSGNYLDHTTGIQELGVFYDRLSKYAAQPCFVADDKLAIMVSCAQYLGIRYGFALTYASVSNDPGGLYWKMDTSSFSPVRDNTIACMSVANDLKSDMCVGYRGTQYEFTLNFAPVSKDPTGIYWKMDITTFRQKK